ncbi:SDR family oxidoreductase [uncultured Hydrogenophaga sp.]|uniref:SDR family oxidoreductase n=1 Tax=uncultured Hydrogenophaga sp. TaxID=199683 RepID=UPI00258D9D15|nr:SDR family oxidoreductase [uncultured Hydrogenophaga sp.]
MKVVVIGGTGLIGSKLVARLKAAGHNVVVGAPNTGVNTLTGEGLDSALAGASVVVDVANSPSFEDRAVMDFFTTSGRNLLAAEKKAGTRHHIALSVVGTDRLQASGYFRAKKAQEDLIKAGGIPYTIVHSTQFFEFAGGIAQSATEGGTVRLSPARIQPISSDDVADALFDVVGGPSFDGVLEIAGPETHRLAELIALYLAAKQDPRKVRPDPQALYFGARLDDATLVPGEASKPRLGKARFADWMGLQFPA